MAVDIHFQEIDDDFPDAQPLQRQGVEVAGVAKALKGLFKDQDIDPPSRKPVGDDELVRSYGDVFVVREPNEDELRALREAFPHTRGKPRPRAGEEDLPVIDINLERINTEDDVKEYIAKVAEVYRDQLKRNTPQTIDYIVEQAEKMGMPTAMKILEGGVEGVKLKDVAISMTAARLAQLNWAMAVRKQTQKYMDAKIDGAPPEEVAALRRSALAGAVHHGFLLTNMLNMKTELARGLSVLNRIIEVDPEQVKAYADLMSRAQNLGHNGSPELEDAILEGFISLPDPAAQSSYVRQLTSRGQLALDMVVEVYINSLLASSTTHMVNIFSNAINGAMTIPERAMAAGMGRVRNRIRVAQGKNPTERVRLSETQASVIGLQMAFLDGLRAFGRAYMSETPADAVSKIELRRRAITGENMADIIPMMDADGPAARAIDFLGKWTFRQPGRFLLAEDEFFKVWFGHAERMSLAARRASELVERGLDSKDAAVQAFDEIVLNPTEVTADRILAAARERTFQTPLDGLMGRMQGFFTHPLMKPVTPFYRTPTNIAKALIDRTPLPLIDVAVVGGTRKVLGLDGNTAALEALGLSDFAKSIREGGPKADMAMGKMSMGAMILGTLSFAMSNAGEDTVFTGSYPGDKKSRETWRRAGLQEFSVCNRGVDGAWDCTSFNRFEPISGLLGMVSEYNQIAKYSDNPDDLSKIAYAMTSGLYHYTTAMPMLQGVSELADNIAYGRPGLEGLETRLNAIFKQYLEAGSSVAQSVGSLGLAPPSLTRLIESTIDPTISGYLPPNHTSSRFMETVWGVIQKTKAGVPVLSETVPPRLNRWGEEVRGPATPWSPIRVTEGKYNKVDLELADMGYGITMPRRRIEGVTLSQGQYDQIIQYSMNPSASPNYDGVYPTLLQQLETVINSEGYAGLEAKKDKLNLLQSVVTKRDQVGRKLMLMENPDLKDEIDRSKVERELQRGFSFSFD